ncbi:ATP-dependent RNA helicase DHX8/PRP22 [Monocercomonoides exilis]|uniref:ATP-dependent RNA helicase DHX8/PRP22 n=1 Tax=Monocercomonoides exilis TaxID=2049356 RepID=UPI00355AB5D3|nr:ATP-dependent RNA helicase DHX8/PRP22 [Monocercomonoides exilis]|eukprot:MONOS_2168.1-p1 / transcript=MONOS_2168.1 / gene=MONOS_2168 / organism=Monocercomonoides_exilis_PA203 / gene_product=ATP-dependent RNA helicase DHX8/PRP22 / transcript_product=ATP-dependent RNA helicase DHX8/PRP22 / location=Mono_scaffold00043:28730-32262(+) / protein_length=1159 / sequence_SO=supercontig / SO=protein_coding / is_pseudo=false
MSFDLNVKSKIVTELERYEPQLASEPFPSAVYDIYVISKSKESFLKQLADSGLDDGSMTNFYERLYEQITKMKKTIIPISELPTKRKDISKTQNQSADSISISSSPSITQPQSRYDNSKKERIQLDDRPEIWKIYDGQVQSCSDSGAYISLDGVRGHPQGLCRNSEYSDGNLKARDYLHRYDRVKVKVISVAARTFDLSMRQVDQKTGADIRMPPSQKQYLKERGLLMEDEDDGDVEDALFRPLLSGAPVSSSSTVPSSFSTVPASALSSSSFASRGHRKQKTDADKWEEKQLLSAGIITREELEGWDQEREMMQEDEDNDDMAQLSDAAKKRLGIPITGSGGVATLPRAGVQLDAEEDVEDIDIEVTEAEPSFLKGISSHSMQFSPLRIVQAPDGSLVSIAEETQKTLKDQREELTRQRNEMFENIPKGLDRGWLDPMPEDNERLLASELRGLGMMAVAGASGAVGLEKLPEWKREALGKHPTFGRPVTKMSIKEQRESLPIYQFRNALLAALSKSQMLIVIGETGSGKTTQIPQYLAEEGYTATGRVGVTQPRRVAAQSVAKRVSEEVGCVLGQEVGYAIRFEEVVSKETVIKYMTDGYLLRECLVDTKLSQYSVIMLDEAHERTIHTDVLFALCKEACRQRPNDLKLIVTSATLDAEKFSSYFNDCPIITIPGRSYEVEVFYAKQPEPNYLEAATIAAMQIHLKESEGDILVFLTGQEEIDLCCSILHKRMKDLGDKVPELIILPVYSSLPSENQTRIFEPAPRGARKCIVATNIAEASLTIDGIRFVIDSGFVKQNSFNPRLGMDSLTIVPISKASAKQRKGRAGRTAPGKCYRLYTESAFKNEMMPTTIPEIQRANLANTVLLLKAMGINDVMSFDFMDKPPRQTLVAALELLYALGALDEEGLLTPIGRRMAEFPLEPQLSKMLLTSVELGCTEEILTIASMISVETIFFRPKDKQLEADAKKQAFSQPEGDHLTYLTIYNRWQKEGYSSTWCARNFIHIRAMRKAQDIRTHLLQIMNKYNYPITSCGRNYNSILQAVVSGFFNHAAKRDPTEGYKTLSEGSTVYIHPSSALFQKNPEWVLYHEVVMTTKEYMRHVSAIDPRWLLVFAPNYYVKVDPRMLSKEKRKQRIEPLYSKFQDANSWRISKQKIRKN